MQLGKENSEQATMAELLVSASTGAMGSVLEKLGTMLSDEYKLLKGIHDDIWFLKDELKAMQAFLLMMADVEKPDPQAKLRADAIREMSYEIEDTIDKFMFMVKREEISKSDGIGDIFNKGMKMIKDIMTRHKIAKDIKEIKSQVAEIRQRHKRYKIDDSSRSGNEKVDPRIVAAYRDAAELVGIDGPRDELVTWLAIKEGESTYRPKVVSIVGYGGLGKTTLAKQVYEKLGANYDCKAFVSVSRSPDMIKILISILSQLRNQDYVHAGDQQLIISNIRDFLKDKRYFIIIDDVWDKPTWQALDCALLKNECGSVIMTTTRIHDVAKLCCSFGGQLANKIHKIHKIQPLSDANSKKLFFKRIFDCEERCPPELKEASEGILKKCGGLPLAINAISSLLATGKTKEEWNRMGRYIGFAQGENSDIDAMDYILSLSYFDLPLHLRSCLLYLTMFPEDYLIERQRLVHMWISEGLIHSKDGKDLAELGETYYHVLINRSLIQPVDIGYDGKASCCQVHDTILDFLIYKSTGENFCTLLSNHLNRDSRVRRLSLMSNDDKENVEKLDLSRVRSVSSFGDADLLPSIVDSNALRVLDMQSCKGFSNRHAKDIGRLFQLRYLNISFTSITELPEQIGDLEYLQTLNASCTYHLAEMPKSITRLRRLARLFVFERTKLPDGIGNMENLQELWRINPLKQSLDFIEELAKLTNLRKLKIIWVTSKSNEASTMKEEKLVSTLCKLDTCNLRSLHIDFELGKHEATFIGRPFLPALKSIRGIELSSGKLCWIVTWLVKLANLQKLVIRNGKVEQDDIEMVGSIPSLVEFHVWTPGTSSTITISGGFQQLRTLCLYFYDGRFMFEAGAMPTLKKLHMDVDLQKFISGGGSFDMGIQHLSSLALLSINLDCTEATVSDVVAAGSELKNTADTLPNRPTLKMNRYGRIQLPNSRGYMIVPWSNQEGQSQAVYQLP